MIDDRLTAKADRKVAHWLEDTSRRLGRRRMLSTGLKGVAAAVAGLTVGSLQSREALAHPGHPYCHFPGHGHCGNLGYGCPSAGGCPSGCAVCTTASGCAGCIYSSGYWASAPACGICRFGYYLCYDCRCTSCNRVCGCRSSCRCSRCCAPAEVRRDLENAMAEAAARN
jgi:hypothetical protein